MQPSATQRREARMRKLALDLGLRVHLQEPPKGSRCPPQRKLLPLYCLPWERSRKDRGGWSLVRKNFSHELHYSGEWDWGDKPSRLPPEAFKQCLQAAPEVVLAVTLGAAGLCVFWEEYGGDQQVNVIADWLREAAASTSVP